MAAIAAGDVSVVLAEILGVRREGMAGAVAESERARALLGFVLSPRYLQIRSKLGMVAR